MYEAKNYLYGFGEVAERAAVRRRVADVCPDARCEANLVHRSGNRHG